MNRLIVPIIVLTFTGAWTAVAFSQTPPRNVNTPYAAANPAPLEGDPTREVRMLSLVLPPGAGNEFHRHNGDQWGLVQEGEVTFTIKGQEPRVLKAGDSVYIPRGTIHRNQNLGDKPARSVEILIVDKGKQLVIRDVE